MIYHCKFGEFGILEGQFTEPSGVAVNAQNDIIVADTNNHRIQIFDKEGRFKFQFGEVGIFFSCSYWYFWICSTPYFAKWRKFFNSVFWFSVTAPICSSCEKFFIGIFSICPTRLINLQKCANVFHFCNCCNFCRWENVTVNCSTRIAWLWWRPRVILSLQKGKRERFFCANNRKIWQFGVVTVLHCPGNSVSRKCGWLVVCWAEHRITLRISRPSSPYQPHHHCYTHCTHRQTWQNIAPLNDNAPSLESLL